MGTLQNITVAGLVAELGLTGHNGITCAANADDGGTLDVTITPPAWALLSDGTLLSSELQDVTIDAPASAGTYTLWLDAEVRPGAAETPVWTVASSAPSDTALAVGAVTVVDVLAWRPGCADTFDRGNQSGWGTASDGQDWHRLAGDHHDPRSTFIQSGSGVIVYVPGYGEDESPTLGDPLPSADVDLVVRWTYSGDDADNTSIGFQVRALDYDHEVNLIFASAGENIVQVYAEQNAHSDAESDPAIADQTNWTHYRTVGADHSWRTWQDGVEEPDSWDGTWHDDSFPEDGLTGRWVGLYASVGVDDPEEEGPTIEDDREVVLFDHFSARYLAPGVSATTAHATGLRNLPLAGLGATTALEIVQMDDDLVLDHASVFVVISDEAAGAHKKLTLPLAADCAGQWIHTMSPSGNSMDTADILLLGEDQLVGADCSMQLLSDGIASWFGMDC